MSEVIKCRPKTKQVEALKTSKGQSLYDIRDFLIGCKNIHFEYPTDSSRNFEEPVLLDSSPALNPGDYVVRDSKGYVAFFSPEEFEAKYELEVSPTELHYVIMKYGFSVEEAKYMLRDESIRAILIAPLLEANKERKKQELSPVIRVNPIKAEQYSN